MSAADETPRKPRRNLLVAAAARRLPRARRAVLCRARRRRSFPAALGADRQAGAADRPAAGAGARCATASRCPGLSNATFAGSVSLVNVWASWCVPCHDEAPLLEALGKDKRIQLVGINYKDAARQRAALPQPLRQSFRRHRRRRERPRRDRLGRLWRAGDLPGRARRPHRLQADRPDHGGKPQSRADAGRSKRRWRSRLLRRGRGLRRRFSLACLC